MNVININTVIIIIDDIPMLYRCILMFAIVLALIELIMAYLIQYLYVLLSYH